jgi:hypothetical protein
MNAIMERWIQTCRRELLDRTLIWNQAHLLHALRNYERHYNEHRPHRGISNSRPLQALPEPTSDSTEMKRLSVRRRDRRHPARIRTCRMTCTEGIVGTCSLAENPQDPVAVLLAKVVDVGLAGLEHAHPATRSRRLPPARRPDRSDAMADRPQCTVLKP